MQTDKMLKLFTRNDINPLDSRGNYRATSNNTKFVRWPLMGGLLHLVHRGGDWVGPQPAQAPTVKFYLYPTVGTVLIHSVKPELTE